MTDKGKILAFPDTAAIEAQAAAWVARFDAGDVSARDQAAFQEWLNRSPLHRQTIADCGDLWSAFDALGQIIGEVPAASDSQVARPALWRRAGPWLAACAASVLLVSGAATYFHARPQTSVHTAVPAPTRFVFETAVGKQRRIALADGSSVMLNTNSRLEVDFTGNRRDVHLMRGEAYFDVVHDRARPFIVYARDYVVRDIGTAFDVHLVKSGLVEVGVTRGSVEVMAGQPVSSRVESLGVVAAGHNILLGGKAVRPEAVPSPDMGRRLAWRRGELIYTGQPLADVLADVSRYSDIQIELADPALRNMPVGGAFRTDQIAAIFAALENNFGIHAEWVGPQHVRFTAGREKLPVKE